MTKEILEQLQAEYPHAVRLHESMQNHTSFRLGGPADALAIPHSLEELRGILAFCGRHELPIFVMGNGSNLLVRDGGIRAVVIKISGALSTIRLTEYGLEAEAGISLSAVAHAAVDAGLGGLEFAAGIPGTLGGGVMMNAGAYGGEMKDVVRHVIALDYDGQEHCFSNEDLQFGYRKCYLQGRDLIVAKVGLNLREQDPNVSRALIADYNQRRREKQPLHLPSAGSVFKRPPGHYAGQLIEEAGLKGKRIGGAEVSTMHAGFIVNVGNATARDVEDLIHYVQQEVFAKFSVHLEPEVRIVGEYYGPLFLD